MATKPISAAPPLFYDVGVAVSIPMDRINVVAGEPFRLGDPHSLADIAVPEDATMEPDGGHLDHGMATIETDNGVPLIQPRRFSLSFYATSFEEVLLLLELTSRVEGFVSTRSEFIAAYGKFGKSLSEAENRPQCLLLFENTIAQLSQALGIFCAYGDIPHNAAAQRLVSSFGKDTAILLRKTGGLAQILGQTNPADAIAKERARAAADRIKDLLLLDFFPEELAPLAIKTLSQIESAFALAPDQA